MKTLLKFALAALLVSFGSTGWGQNVYNKFSPSTGVLKGSSTSYFTQAAVSADIRGLWSGTCDATTFLRGDGSCVAPAGTGITFSMPSGFTVTGSPGTTISVTTALSGVLKGNGSAFTTAVAADVYGLWSGTCNASSFLRGDGACAAAGGGTPAGADTQVQFNNTGSFGADSDFTWDLTNNILTVGSSTTAGTIRGGAGTAAGAALSVLGGAGGTGAGGAINITGGSATASSQAGGAVSITGGSSSAGAAGSVTIAGRNASGSNNAGGAVTVTGGNPTGTGTPGAITITPGQGGTGSAIAGATLTLNGGNGGSGGGNGGTAAINGGNGGGAGSATGGSVLITGGLGAPTGAGGPITISGGTGGSTSGAGGTAALVGGSSNDGAGGQATLLGQNGNGTNRAGGAANVTSGNGIGSGAGGNVNITAGTSPSGTSGSIIFNTGGATAATVFPDGGTTLGSPTGGDPGAGALNTAGDIKVNNVSVCRSDGTNCSSGNTTNGSFTATIIGCTTSPTLTVTYSVFGKIVTLRFPSSATCTSNSTGLSMSGATAAVRPSSGNVDGSLFPDLEDNGNTTLMGAFNIDSSGTMTFSKFNTTTGAFSSVGFTAANTKGLCCSQATITYQVP